MERLRRIKLIIYENSNFEIFPIQKVIKLVPLVLLLPKEEHGVHFVIHFEIIVIAESSKEYGLVSTEWGLPLSFLWIFGRHCLHFEQFHVASIHFGGWCPAIVRQMLIPLGWELEKKSVIESAKAISLFIQLQCVTISCINQSSISNMFKIESVHVDLGTIVMVVILPHDLHFDIMFCGCYVLGERVLRYEQTLTFKYVIRVLFEFVFRCVGQLPMTFHLFFFLILIIVKNLTFW